MTTSVAVRLARTVAGNRLHGSVPARALAAVAVAAVAAVTAVTAVAVVVGAAVDMVGRRTEVIRFFFFGVAAVAPGANPAAALTMPAATR